MAGTRASAQAIPNQMSVGPVAPMPAMYGTGYGMPAMYGTGYGMPSTISAPIGTMQMPIAAPTMGYGSYAPQAGAMMGAPATGVGAVHPDFPQFGPAQPYPTTVTPQDEMLLQRLQQMGHTAGVDGLPGYPYIGAPYIGVWSSANEEGYQPPAEEPAYTADEDEVRGTQV
mmetsp:Transcript_57079/g.140031  ORF Transcript_57079/g.140031 Transcript_57079/m.140031 type:complete len:170 (-) Transcript_57079:105-614(-)